LGRDRRPLDIESKWVLRFRSPAELVDVFRHNYGPVRNALDALDDDCERLDGDLAAVATRLESGASRLPLEYVEAVAVRGS
jgi:hypothetical protein